ncbi:hypothetical protein KGF56_002443 [Candida oxycetoniae]|uniref:MARVEL domain-containing protein n=1 Tax=Candida oxycetoniae TaxID=497107 RepID=A0AAI9WY76_9ASCO|nr:uncharacterized protein KGF56_002443 [Candida oxycetoniae]KAI3404740.2 hypothetical protein KGF56_002443 [Candida oxycetoniae]
MVNVQEIISIIIRVLETILAIIALGLAGGFTADISLGRVIFTIVTAAESLVYLGYVEFLVPVAFKGKNISTLVFCCEVLNTLLYLVSWAIIAGDFPSDCNNSSWGKSNCQIYQAILPFTLLNWLLFSISFGLFLGFSYIPEIQRFSGAHTLKPTKYYWGSIFIDLPSVARQCCGLLLYQANVDKNALGEDPHKSSTVSATSPRDQEANAGIIRDADDPPAETASSKDAVTAGTNTR